MANKKLRHLFLLRVIEAVFVLLSVSAFAVCWYSYYGDIILDPFYAKGDYVVIGIYMIFVLLFSEIYDALKFTTARTWEVAYSQVLSIGLSDVMIYLIICLLAKGFPWMGPGLLCFAIQAAMAVIWSFLANRLYFFLFNAKKTIIIYDTRENLDQLIDQYGLSASFDIVKTVSVQECLEDLSVLKGAEVAFFSGVHSHDRNTILKKCVEDGICAYVIPRIGDVIMSGAQRMHMFHLPMLRVERYQPAIEFLLLKRLLDIVVSVFFLVLLSPIMLITAIAIKISDRGPIFYRQNRLTKDGKVFKIVKFRSMRVDAEKDGVARLSSGGHDSRITPVGRVIRQLRIDEMPQFWNILVGDMSLIGPRPERPEIAAQYEEVMPEFRLRLQVKAGLTGYAQVYGKYNSTPYDKLQMDLMYIANPSPLEDISILFATIKILFMPDSTEGIDESATTAMQEPGKTENDETIHRAV